MMFATILAGRGVIRMSYSRPASNPGVRTSQTAGPFRIAMVAVVLGLVICTSTFNLYLSPITKKENQQVAESELVGMKWFFEHRDQSMSVYELGLSQLRFYQALFGVAAPATNLRYGPVATPVDHFGYQNGTALG